MCYTLNAEKILLNYFHEAERSRKKNASPSPIDEDSSSHSKEVLTESNRTNADRITFEALGRLSCDIVNRCENSIIVQINIHDIIEATQKWPTILEMSGSSVKLKENASPIYIDILNQAMPELVKEKCREACEDYFRV
jgi:hypothetical protein